MQCTLLSTVKHAPVWVSTCWRVSRERKKRLCADSPVDNPNNFIL